ncbi:oxygenase MpaB family protein [Streptomyces phytohabitans]|uniref:oxygenase MpaB family protein n=1 Tax=Streptomyces phytohabitans TaxID=1150371 RepID=UPI00345B6D1E
MAAADGAGDPDGAADPARTADPVGTGDAPGARGAGGAARGPGAVEPLGPDSLTWRYFGDWRGVLLAPWAGVMQNMHPGLGAGVAEHSRFFEERWQRLYRSLYPIGGVVYDGPRAAETARQVRGYHDTVKGVDAYGRPYHALDPDTFYWAHATFFMLTVLVADRFGPGLDEGEKRRLYAEHVRWYALYGMSMRPVPGSWEEFQAYWDRMAAEVLEDTRPARDVLDIRRIAKPPALSRLPDVVWRVLRGPQARLTVWVTVGLLPPAARRRLGYDWTVRDERRLRRLGRVVHHGWRLVPPARRYHPRARAGWERAAGRRSPDAPVVETPARNLPPASERGSPRHHAPRV